MEPVVIEYGRAPNRVGRLTRWLKLIAVLVAIVIFSVAVPLMYRATMHELSLEGEEKRLLIANMPTNMFPTLTVQFTSNADIILPNGQVARLAWVDLSQAVDRQQLPQDFAGVLQLIRAKKLGYSVIAADASGSPVVQLWALSPYAYHGLCGNSSNEERRTSGWMLWRNVNDTLMEERGFDGNGIEAERAQDHTKVDF